ncbi:MAG: pentapeptide repeat-containing protein [Oscillatoriales cyanobacterium SM2_2_1]|nr:pentapeptide repeat-containing protein [Oscillatoriales cyanobacterium SM2_2_1]
MARHLNLSRSRSLGRRFPLPPPVESSPAIRNQKPPSKISPLASIEDLGVEVFSTDDNTDWSGLLESTEVSDSISAVMDQRREQRVPPKSRLRVELSSLDDHAVREPTITRTQTTSTQARPDKVPQRSAPSSFNLSMLKGPLIGLAVVGVGAGAVVVFQRPILESALKVGIWKNASGMDLQRANFRGANLAGVSFDQSNLSGVNFEQANLEDATFIETNLDNASLARANLTRARIIRASVVFTNFNGARLNNADLLGSSVERSNFTGAVMRGVNLRGVKLGAGDRTARLDPPVRRIWQIVNQPQPRRNLANLDLSGANLSSSELVDVNFNGANLSFANLANANLRGANFRGANLRGLNLTGARLNGANFRDARLDRRDVPRTSNATICPNGSKGPCRF